MELPSYDVCELKVKAGNATALHKFIYYQEPAGNGEKDFREGLSDVLEQLQTELNALQTVNDELRMKLQKIRKENERVTNTNFI